ncbi:hypothetical protein F6V30_14405 [Oryzomonas sagensis]|uniref:Uncharacterized protein n=1 Tax=Oryzomonas sagensis TaxID=2603857 RepID=A0ABQ6TL68_9BACT|nr:hypothetical protein [Oryzomonas sagensis]KAB0669025.1 hypothetical protein F6V30_14405 [Oryzomonas sagensis]
MTTQTIYEIDTNTEPSVFDDGYWLALFAELGWPYSCDLEPEQAYFVDLEEEIDLREFEESEPERMAA